MPTKDMPANQEPIAPPQNQAQGGWELMPETNNPVQGGGDDWGDNQGGQQNPPNWGQGDEGQTSQGYPPAFQGQGNPTA